MVTGWKRTIFKGGFVRERSIKKGEPTYYIEPVAKGFSFSYILIAKKSFE